MFELFPALPEDLASIDTDELRGLLSEYGRVALEVRDGTADLHDLTAEQVMEQMRAASEGTVAMRAELAEREQAEANFQSEAEALASEIAGESGEEGEGEGEGSGEGEGAAAGEGESEGEGEGEGEGAESGEGVGEGEVSGEGEAGAERAGESAGEDEGSGVVAPEPGSEEELQAAAATQARPPARRLAIPRGPSRFQPQAAAADGGGAVLTAAINGWGPRAGDALDRESIARLCIEGARRLGRPTHHEGGVEERHLIATARFPYPEDRILRDDDPDGNAARIRAAVPETTPWGQLAGEALVASGGLCAPLTPIYDLPNFAVTDRPVRDALVSFNATRGGVNVPTPDYIADITTAIDVISEAEDALGGTFATKSCQSDDCEVFTEVAVTIISHCRQYGNMNARAWPEHIAQQNDLTMAAHARTAEGFLLDRIKALSINTTQAKVYNAVSSLVYAIVKSKASIRYNLRMRPDARFRALLPAWLPDLLAFDIVNTQFDRFRGQAAIEGLLRLYGIEPTWYLDNVSTGTSQAFAAETASAIDDFPDDVQWALFPEGMFIHVDGGELELGLVRDSTLNSTNDFQFFGETFENVARLGPTQAARWVTSTVCPDGTFPALQTALAC